jgi:hypothetical protein
MSYTPLPATVAEMRQWVERLELDLVRQYAGQRPDLPADFWRAVAVAKQRLRLMEQIEVGTRARSGNAGHFSEVPYELG